MAKVYLTQLDHWDWTEVHGAFSSREKATSAMMHDVLAGKHSVHDFGDIVALEVDKDVPDFEGGEKGPLYESWIEYKTGEAKPGQTHEDVFRHPTRTLVERHYLRGFAISPISQEDADRLVAEKREWDLENDENVIAILEREEEEQRRADLYRLGRHARGLLDEVSRHLARKLQLPGYRMSGFTKSGMLVTMTLHTPNRRSIDIDVPEEHPETIQVVENGQVYFTSTKPDEVSVYILNYLGVVAS